MNEINIKILIMSSIGFFITSCVKKNITNTNTSTYEERMCCVYALKDSTKTWCEKIELVENCKETISPCWDAIVREMEKKTGIYCYKIGTEFGLNYPNLNDDLKKWKEVVGCK